MNNQYWYKDKVFYQIWPRSFKDGNGDGMGRIFMSIWKNLSGMYFHTMIV